MTEHRPPWPADPTPVDRGLWQGYGVLTSEADARAAFLAKYGYPPKHIERSKGAVLAGPVEEEINDGT